jgi:hypothetical protein
MGMNTTTASAPIVKTSKQRQDEMYARLAAAEARIAVNHQRYTEIMAHMDKGQEHNGGEHADFVDMDCPKCVAEWNELTA